MSIQGNIVIKAITSCSTLTWNVVKDTITSIYSYAKEDTSLRFIVIVDLAVVETFPKGIQERLEMFQLIKDLHLSNVISWIVISQHSAAKEAMGAKNLLGVGCKTFVVDSSSEAHRLASQLVI